MKYEDYKLPMSEQFLCKNWYLLATGQLTANRFLMKSFRVIWIMASVISHNKSIIAHTYISVTLDSCIQSWFRRHTSNENMQIGTGNKDSLPSVFRQTQH